MRNMTVHEKPMSTHDYTVSQNSLLLMTNWGGIIQKLFQLWIGLRQIRHKPCRDIRLPETLMQRIWHSGFKNFVAQTPSVIISSTSGGDTLGNGRLGKREQELRMTNRYIWNESMRKWALLMSRGQMSREASSSLRSTVLAEEPQDHWRWRLWQTTTGNYETEKVNRETQAKNTWSVLQIFSP